MAKHSVLHDLIDRANEEGIDADELSALMRALAEKSAQKKTKKKKETLVNLYRLMCDSPGSMLWWSPIDKKTVKDDFVVIVKSSKLNVRTIVNQNGFQPLERIQEMEFLELKVFRIHFPRLHRHLGKYFSTFYDISDMILNREIPVVEAYTPQCILDWLSGKDI
jgi:hypothetical protein